MEKNIERFGQDLETEEKDFRNDDQRTGRFKRTIQNYLIDSLAENTNFKVTDTEAFQKI